jgi:hypothetical protein
MKKYVFACTVLVETPDESLLPNGIVLSATYRSISSVEELVKKVRGFSLKPFGNMNIGWANELRGGEREIVVSATNIVEAASLCKAVWEHYKVQ